MGFKIFKLERNSSHDIFKCIFLKANFGIVIWVLIKFVAKGPVDSYVSIGSAIGLMPNRLDTKSYSWLILGLRPANDANYKITPSLIGWAQT